jgi:tyrosyl-tRNA synthetase
VGNCCLRVEARTHLLAKRIALTHNLLTGALGGHMGASAFGRKGVTLAIALWAWPAAGFAYTMEQQQACMGDAFRLCSSEIPDIERITMCMVRRQVELSPACRVYFTAAPASSAISKAARARKSRQAHHREDTDG